MTQTVAPFTRTIFYAAIGVSVFNDRCCVYIDTQEPTGILQPSMGRKYVTYIKYTFEAPKKAPFTAIIANLRYMGVWPKHNPANFIPPKNPDNKYYIDLPMDSIELIKKIISDVAGALSFGVPVIVSTLTPDELLAAQSREYPDINPDQPAIIIITPKGKSSTCEIFHTNDNYTQ